MSDEIKCVRCGRIVGHVAPDALQMPGLQAARANMFSLNCPCNLSDVVLQGCIAGQETEIGLWRQWRKTYMDLILGDGWKDRYPGVYLERPACHMIETMSEILAERAKENAA